MKYLIFSNDEEVLVSNDSNINGITIECETFDDAVDVARQYSAYDWSNFKIKRVESCYEKEYEYNNYMLDHYLIDADPSGYYVEFYPRIRSNEELYKMALDILIGGET